MHALHTSGFASALKNKSVSVTEGIVNLIIEFYINIYYN